MSKKEGIEKEKSKASRNRILVRIMASILAILMVAGIAFTCVYYIIYSL